MPAAAAPPPRDLHTMVGLGRHATISELRYAYEQAMADAVRRGDHKHAVALSAAYDALSGVRRSQVYGSQLGGASHPNPVAARGGTAQRASRAQLARPAAARRRARAGAILRKVAVYTLVIPASVAIGVSLLIHLRPADGGLSTPRQDTYRYTTQPPAQVAGAPVATFTPVATPKSGSRYVPLNTPTTAQGVVIILCELDPLARITQPVPIVVARPGTVVSCPNGAIPVIDR